MNKSSIYMGVLFMGMSLFLASCNNQEDADKAEKNYKTLTISNSNSSIIARYSASIRGEQFVDIRPQITGVITNILVKEGAEIKKGQTLFIIDQIPYKAALDVATANVKSAQSQVAIAKLNAQSCQSLYEEAVISDIELQIAKNTLLSAEADLALALAEETNAKNNLSYTVIESPVDGVASMIPYRVGALVDSSIDDPLVSVSNNKNMYAYFSMSESLALSLIQESGSTENFLNEIPKVTLTLNNGVEYEHKGTVDAISGTIDRTTGTLSLRAAFDNPEYILRDGGSGTVVINTNIEDVIVIPKVATFEIQNMTFAFKVVDGVANSVQLKVYPLDNGVEYIVESGLEIGDVIIAEGAGILREGTKIGKSNNAESQSNTDKK